MTTGINEQTPIAGVQGGTPPVQNIQTPVTAIETEIAEKINNEQFPIIAVQGNLPPVYNSQVVLILIYKERFLITHKPPIVHSR